MKIVIFGGGGFIGSTVADRLLRDHHEIRIFERPRVEPYREFSANERVEWVTGDFQSSSDVSEAIDGTDVVFHLISTTLPKNSNDDPIYDIQSNLVATLQMLNAMVAKKVPRIVFISSGGTVYGTPKYLPVDEHHPTDPLVSYGIMKLAIEKYLRLFERIYGITAITLRVSNPYGERQRVETAQGAVGVFLHRAIMGLPIDIWGDGSVTRDFIHVSDVSEAFVRALVYSGKERIFNISSEKGTSVNEIIDLLSDVLGKPVERRYLPGRPFDVPVNILSNGLARTELKWQPEILLRQGIARTSEWLKSTLGM